MMNQFLGRQDKRRQQKQSHHAPKDKPKPPDRSLYDVLRTRRNNGLAYKKSIPKSLQRQQHESPAGKKSGPKTDTGSPVKNPADSHEKYDPNQDTGTPVGNPADGGVLGRLLEANLNDLGPITGGERDSPSHKRRKHNHGRTQSLNSQGRKLAVPTNSLLHQMFSPPQQEVSEIQHGASSFERRKDRENPKRRSSSGGGTKTAAILSGLGKSQSKKNTARSPPKGWKREIPMYTDLTPQSTPHSDDEADQSRDVPVKKRERELYFEVSPKGKVRVGFTPAGAAKRAKRRAKLAQNGRRDNLAHAEQRGPNDGKEKRHQHHQMSQEKEAPEKKKKSVCDGILSDDGLDESFGSHGDEPSNHSTDGSQDSKTKSHRGPGPTCYRQGEDPTNDLNEEGGGDNLLQALDFVA